jgi:hypothetical protein
MESKLNKAYFVHFSDEYFGQYVHAKNAGQAKKRAAATLECCGHDWIYLRAHRVPQFDDRPFIYTSMVDYGVLFEDKETAADTYNNYCPCDVCKGVEVSDGK